MPLPLPPSFHEFFQSNAKPNPSLLLDRGYDAYADNWSDQSAEEKRKYLQRIVATAGDPQLARGYQDWLRRRTAALAEVAASPLDLVCSSALMVGLGRKNAADAGVTLDRAWGSPYVPGSSVKGLLRSTAELVVSGEIGNADDRPYWESALDGLFGAGTSGESGGSKASLAFYDAYPIKADVLELGIVTPHYQEYYANAAKPPADWYDPVPVAVLQVKPGTTFRFWLPTDAALRARLTSLLVLGLDWLGLGAKTSSGFGWFDANQPIAVPAATPVRTVLEHAELTFAPNTGELGVVGDKAFTKERAVLSRIPELIARLKKRKQVFARVTVEVQSNQRIIVLVEPENG